MEAKLPCTKMASMASDHTSSAPAAVLRSLRCFLAGVRDEEEEAIWKTGMRKSSPSEHRSAFIFYFGEAQSIRSDGPNRVDRPQKKKDGT